MVFILLFLVYLDCYKAILANKIYINMNGIVTLIGSALGSRNIKFNKFLITDYD